MAVPQPVPKWDVETVCGFLSGIGLPQLQDAFRANAVGGSDLIDLSDEDFKESLGCTALQTKKIRKELVAYGINPPAAAAAAAAPMAAAAAPPPPAPFNEAPPPVASAPPPPEPTRTESGHDDSAAAYAEIEKMSARVAEVQRGAMAYSAAQQELRHAEQGLKSAATALTVTQASGATETLQDMKIGRRGGGLFGRHHEAGRKLDRQNDMGHNVVEMATISRASGMVKEAAGHIQRAKQHVPQLPFIQPANVQAAMGGVLFNAVLAPGLVGDMMQNSKVRRAKDQVRTMQTEVQQALDWCTNNMNAAQAEVSQLNGSLQAKRAQLGR